MNGRPEQRLVRRRRGCPTRQWAQSEPTRWARRDSGETWPRRVIQEHSRTTFRSELPSPVVNCPLNYAEIINKRQIHAAPNEWHEEGRSA